MKRFRGAFGAVASAVLLVACGGTNTETPAPNTSTTRGTLVYNPPVRIASLTAANFQAELAGSTSGQQLLQVTGAPTCGVDFYYLKFNTVGAANEATVSSGALMVPTGGAGCSGPRPIVLYAHGTQTLQTANIADITNTSNTEGALIAAMFAAQGYIVVAPNYAGYDISTLGYHPFLNASQQSGEMMDVLAAARSALPNVFSSGTTDSGKLFITGYSEGGYVAMATMRAMQDADPNSVTAAAPMSGPYALEAFGDAILFGAVNLGSTVFVPLITTSYQKAYGNIYSSPSDLYSAQFATGIETLLPSPDPLSTLFANGKLPQTALFNITTPVVTLPDPTLSAALTAALAVPSDPQNPQTPLFQLGFGDPYLLNNSARVNYALDAATNPDGAVPTPTANVPLAANPPTYPLRKALYLNDMRNGPWGPMEPTLLCGGDQDPTVFFSVNTGTMAAFWSMEVQEGIVSVLDVNATPAGPYAPIQQGFQQSQQQLLLFYESAAGGGLTPAAAMQQLVQGYHSSVAPFCARAAKLFFDKF